MMIKLILVGLVIGGTSAVRLDRNKVSWSGGTFDWPSVLTKSLYANAGKYIKKNVIATRAVIHDGQAILALPRFKPGVPATLASIPLTCTTGRPALSAFPCWSMHIEGDCRSFQNVVDLYLDANKVLWALDTGIVDSLDAPVRKCPPKVVAIDMATRKLVKTVDLSPLANKISRLQYIVSDYSPNGHALIYVTDAAQNAIIVYDVTAGCGYRVILPKEALLGTNRRHVLYSSLVRRPDGTGVLLFSYFSGKRLFSIPTSDLQNNTAQAKVRDLGSIPKKMIMLGTNNGKVVFFRYEGQPEVYAWDATTAFCAQNFHKVANGDGCLLATEVVPDYERGGMRLLETNFPDFVRGTLGTGIDHSLTLM